MRAAIIIATLATLAMPLAARAGVVVELEHPGGHVTYVAQGKKLRIEGAAGMARVTIFDGDAEEVLSLDPDARTYQVTTQADAKALSAQFDAMLARLGPEQRAQAEAAMQKNRSRVAALPDVKYEPVGTNDVVAGYPCQVYQVIREGRVSEEGCFIPWGSGAVTKDDLRALVEFGDFMQRFVAAATGGRQTTSARIGDQIARAPGFPALMQRVADDGKNEKEEWLVSLKHADVPPATFAVPPGFTKIDNPRLGAGAQRPRR